MAKREPTIERRYLAPFDVELRDDGTNGSSHFRGHAAVFDQMTSIAGAFRERIAPGAFKKTLAELGGKDRLPVGFLWNHNQDTVMASTESGTLRLREDGVGLLADADLDPTDWDVQRLIPKIKRGDVSKMSFAFRSIRDDWEDEPEDGGLPIRTLQEVQLFDVSPVTFPAYIQTDGELLSVRALADADPHVKELLAAKTEEGDEDRQVDNSEWDGNAAMTACDSAACYRAICAGRKAGDPDERGSWALPHHKTPDSPPNAAGVRNALARIAQTQGLTNKEAAQSHLDRHMSAISPEEDKVSPDEERDEVDTSEEKDSTARNEPPETEPSREDHSLRAKALIRRQRLEEVEKELS